MNQELSKVLIKDIDRYIKKHLIAEKEKRSLFQPKIYNLLRFEEEDNLEEAEVSDFSIPLIDAEIAGVPCFADLDESFMTSLFRMIDDKGLSEVDIYKKANIDRRHFSKMRSNPAYVPRKRTVVALAIALELDLDLTKDLLAKAGYALSRSMKFDVIIEYFIIHKKYDIHEINAMLMHYDQALLGS